MTRRELLRGAAASALLPLAGTAALAAPRTHRIVMARMRFGPVPSGIRLGDTIVWVNDDVVPHTATARNGSFDIDLPAHRSARMRVTRSGSFAFYCRYHPAMRGTLAIAR